MSEQKRKQRAVGMQRFMIGNLQFKIGIHQQMEVHGTKLKPKM
jgi:hypothetical protein